MQQQSDYQVQDALELYPGNWLYNAGVIGLLRVLENIGTNVESLFDYEVIINIEKEVRNSFGNHAEENNEHFLNKMQQWHWHYVNTTFEWNYGNIKEFVSNIVKRAKNSSNKSTLKNKLHCMKKKDKSKDKVYSMEFDFTDVNNNIDEIWKKAFAKKSDLSENEAIYKLVDTISSKKEPYIYQKAIGYLFAKGGFHQNLLNPSQFSDLEKFKGLFNLSNILSESSYKQHSCSFCSRNKYYLYPVDLTLMSFLFPVFSKFPNAYWQNKDKQVTQICSFCKFIIIHHHLALTRLSDGSEIFINAPSFQVMWHLNQFAQKMYGSTSGEERRHKREILAMSIIEYATRIQTTLGKWAGMNIEIVSKKYDEVNYFSIPHTTVQILSDPQIATLLYDIGEFKILNIVLNQQYGKLLDIGYKVLRTGSKEQQNNTDFINDFFFLDKNKKNPNDTAYKLCKLHALIEEKIKKYKL